MSMTQTVMKQIAPFMKARGFKRSGRNFYYIANDIAFCIGFDMPTGLLYVTAHIVPLYLPSKSRHYNYSVRTNEVYDWHLPILNKFQSSEDVVGRWCDDFCKCIDAHILPLYREMETPKRLLQIVEKGMNHGVANMCVSPVHRARLRMYTQLYLGNYLEVVSDMITYRNLLTQCDYLTALVCQKHLDEIDKVETLIRGNEQDIIDYLAETIERTKRIFK